ncbi:MAG: hypothetical protein IKJ94_06575 [Oscillospiraceae bacterium]|nr:hypothetical protein [Oscillospiraceae bacterium]
MSTEQKPERKRNRLIGFDYSTPGAYFITVCTDKRRNLLCQLVGGGDLDAPEMRLTETGKIVERYILSASKMPGIIVDKFVIMPNHLHIIAFAERGVEGAAPYNSQIPRFVGALKRLCHKEAGEPFFQRSYHDRVIRNEKEYRKIWQYIDTNPIKWKEDCFYNEE